MKKSELKINSPYQLHSETTRIELSYIGGKNTDTNEIVKRLESLGFKVSILPHSHIANRIVAIKTLKEEII